VVGVVITYSIIQKNQLESAKRIDAEYYQPEYLELNNLLLSLKTDFLSTLCKITDGNHSKISERFVSSGVRYLRGQDLAEFFVSDNDPMYIPNEIYSKLKRSHIFYEDVLVSIVGTVGSVSIAAKPIDKLTGNCKIAILHSEKIDPWFLAVFLHSKYGQSQIHRKVAGTVQTGIILKNLAKVIVPIFGEERQQAIKKIAIDAYKNQTDGKFLYMKAESLLLDELGIKDFHVHDDSSYIVNLSEIKSARRTDAEYFQPKYEKLLKEIQNKNLKPLNYLVSMKKGIEPGSDEYLDEGKLFIRVSNLSTHGINARDQKYLSNELYQSLRKDCEPKTGEILLTKDATPGIAYVLKEPIEGIISSGILRIKIKDDVDTEYLALCINSIVGQMQIQRDAGGSIITHWKPEQIKRLQIPIFPKPTQQKIADLVRQSHEARRKSKELLEQAKKTVEQYIEDDRESV
jgi:restriction endonuclease S subunit